MKPSKVYIISHNETVSKEYARTAAESCERAGMPYEIVDGFSNMDPNEAWNSDRIGLKRRISRKNNVDKAQLCSASHAAVWKKILDNKECAVVFEHDSLMLHRPDVDIPDEGIVVLGYKVVDPQNYDHKKAGPPQRIMSIPGHEGAHAYAITWKTARAMLEELEKKGVGSAVDNMYFLKSRNSYTRVPIFMMVPTPAIGWLRKSTIWSSGSSTRNYAFVESFVKNYKSG